MRNEIWVGTSFEVGNFLGMNLLQKPNLLRARNLRSQTSHESMTTSSEAIAGPSSQAEGKSFVTAPLAPPTTSGSSSDIQGSINGVSPPETPSALSTTGLLRPSIVGPMPSASRTEPLRISTPTTPAARREGGILSPLSRKNWKGKAKQVHYAEPPANEEPAPPREVLERSGCAVDGTSAGASVGDIKTPARADGDVIMRGEHSSESSCPIHITRRDRSNPRSHQLYKG